MAGNKTLKMRRVKIYHQAHCQRFSILILEGLLCLGVVTYFMTED